MVNSRAKGIRAEQAVARYFQAAGCIEARRLVAAGWRNGATSAPDLGDVAVDGLAVQVKNLAKPLVGKALSDVWADTMAQAAAGRDDRRPILIEKRTGTADVGRWWLWLASEFYLELLTGRTQLVLHDHLVRVELGSVIGDIRIWIRTRQR
jgi:hypothetical protein